MTTFYFLIRSIVFFFNYHYHTPVIISYLSYKMFFIFYIFKKISLPCDIAQRYASSVFPRQFLQWKKAGDASGTIHDSCLKYFYMYIFLGVVGIGRAPRRALFLLYKLILKRQPAVWAHACMVSSSSSIFII